MGNGWDILFAVLSLSLSVLNGPVLSRGLVPYEPAWDGGSGTKLFGGSKAGRASYRYTVWIQLNGLPVCGGSLVDDQWVLTAAICLESERRLRFYRIWVGDYNIANTKDKEFKTKPLYFVIHPDFDPSVMANDVALIRLERPAPLRRRNIELVPSLAPPSLPDSLLVNSSCYITGWGKKHSTQRRDADCPAVIRWWPGDVCYMGDACKVQNKDFSDQKRLRVLPVRIETTCATPESMCYDPAPGGSCPGDIGWPLMCVDPSNVEIQVGINQGESCTDNPAPATRVSDFYPWIDSVINPMCPQFAAPANGQVTFTGILPGDTAQIVCYSGYRLNVYTACKARATCQMNGLWDPFIGSVTCDPVCDSAGTSFMFGYIQNKYPNGKLYLYIVASGPTDVSLQYPFLASDTFNLGEITAYLATQLPSDLAASDNPEATNKGIRLTASQPVTVYIESYAPVYTPGSGPSADGTLVMPESCLGTAYVAAAHDVNPDAFNPGGRLLVIATADNTDVSIRFPTGLTIPTQMNSFDTYSVFSTVLSGAAVTATKNVAVISGHECANVPNKEQECDHLMEQMPPISTLGTYYIVTNFKPRPGYAVRIIATVAGDTEVFIWDSTGSLIETVTLAERQTFFKIFETLTRSDDNIPIDVISITSTNAILVAQYSEGTTSDTLGFGDPSMVIVPALNQFRESYRVYAPDFAQYDQNWVSIIVPVCYGIDGLRINNEPVVSTNAHIVTVPNIGEYAVIYQKIGTEPVLITHTDEMGLGANFGVIQYGFSDRVQYAWAAGRVY